MELIPLPPAPVMPDAVNIPFPNMPPPLVEMPTWTPVPIKPEDIIPLPKTNTQQEKEKQVDKIDKPNVPVPGSDVTVPSAIPEVRQVEIPFTDITIPVPREEIVATAVTTAGAAAVASVGATMVAGKLFSQIVKIAKPIIKAVVKKIAKVRGKPAPETWARQQLKESRLRKLGKTDSKGGS